MFGWFRSKSILSDDWRDWIDWRFQWLREEFGDALLQQPMVTPTRDFFPDLYFGSRADVEKIFDRVCKLMLLDRSRIKLQFYHHQGYAQIVRSGFNASGLFDEDEHGQIVIWLEESQLFDVARVVATCAHELAHVHLIADRHCTTEEIDHEHLTDLLSICCGLGVFTANAIRRDKSWQEGAWAFNSLETSGYLKMHEAAYGLARCAHFRGEKSPTWTKHLRSDVRADFKYELGELTAGRRIVWSGTLDQRPAGMSQLIFQSNPASVEIASTTDASTSSTDESETAEELDDQLVTVDKVHTDDDDGNADQLFTLGLQYSSEARYPEAIDAFTRAIKLSPGDSEVYLERSKAYLGTDCFEEAISDATRRLKSVSDDAYALRYRTAARLELGQFNEAITDFNQIHKTEQSAFDFLQRGLAYAAIGKLKQAIKDFSSAIYKDPYYADPYLARSRVYHATGERELAQRDFDEALHRNGDYADQDLRDSLPASRLPIRP